MRPFTTGCHRNFYGGGLSKDHIQSYPRVISKGHIQGSYVVDAKTRVVIEVGIVITKWVGEDLLCLGINEFRVWELLSP